MKPNTDRSNVGLKRINGREVLALLERYDALPEDFAAEHPLLAATEPERRGEPYDKWRMADLERQAKEWRAKGKR